MDQAKAEASVQQATPTSRFYQFDGVHWHSIKPLGHNTFRQMLPDVYEIPSKNCPQRLCLRNEVLGNKGSGTTILCQSMIWFLIFD